MSSVEISLSLCQTQAAASVDLQAIVDIAQSTAIPVPASVGDLTVRVVSPTAYRAHYVIQTDNLVAGPVNMVAPRIVQDPESGMFSIVLQGLWATDEMVSPPVFTYRWQRNGDDIPGATGTQYMPLAADAGQDLAVIETTTDSNGARSQSSNAVSVAVLPDLFAVVLDADGTLQLTGNDGRSFEVDDPADIHDGTYSVDPAALAAGPVALNAPRLAPDSTAEADETLVILPGLFAYDPALGAVTLSYEASGTNAVDTTDPDHPTLQVDAADAGTTLTVTAQATQGTNRTDILSNGVAISEIHEPTLQVAAIGIQEIAETTDTLSFSIDLDGYASGDLIYIAFGTTDRVSSIRVGGTAPTLVNHNLSGSSGTRVRVYEHVMTGTSTTTAIAITTGSNRRNDHIIAVAGVKGGARAAASPNAATTARTVDNDQIVATVTPASVNNCVLAFALGRDDMFGEHSWSGASELFTMSGSISGAAIALATDVPVAPYSIRFTGDPAAAGAHDRAVIASITLTEV